MLPFTAVPICFSRVDIKYQTPAAIFPLFARATRGEGGGCVRLPNPKLIPHHFPFFFFKFFFYLWVEGVINSMPLSLLFFKGFK